MKEPILSTRNLDCGYGKVPVLTDINIDIDRGEIVSIIGPNGAGKTTLLRTLTQHLKHRQGEIRFERQNMATIPRKDLARKIAVVGQVTEQPMISVGEYVLLGRLPFFRRYQLFESGEDKRVADHYMKLTNTWDLKDAMMNEISGGERQLAAIARALTQEPVLLLLDEPTAHLDISHQHQIMELVATLNRDLQLTVLMVIHDLNLASEYSDRLILLDGTTGRIHHTGPPQAVLTRRAIETVYQTNVLVDINPASGNPFIFLVKTKHPTAG
ncbi:MAG: ABC transporter ATP-binding protein [Thermodesulfobacteriota bacterium]|nr:ABC transporter ATP-binding protein [Thermodesulfobacteriota bacterium]